MDNRFNRIELLIGKNNLDKIKNKCVLIIGLGGVGGYALETLIRNGIENIIIVDYDTIDITNTNRQIIALSSTLGLKKTDAFLSRAKDINPNIKIIKYDLFLDETNINDVFSNKIDYVIDACDDLKAKKLIIKICLDNGIKFISSMGTAKKMDPTKLNIIELKNTNYDKIAKILRKWVKDEHIKGKIMTVSSNETVINTVDNRKLGSMSFVPNTAGMLCAKYVIDDILK